jgi:GDP-4-dehydro-6-deoxy-D-mannose reductase
LRDFLYVDDVVEAYVALADRSVPAGVYNVASGTGVRIGDALTSLLRLAEVDARVQVDPTRLRPTDHAVGDARRLREATGWQPRVPFEQTLMRLLEDWGRRVSVP